VTLFFPLSWVFPNADIIVLQEAWKHGADVGIVISPFHNKEAIELASCSGLPIMVDNGAYTAWKQDVKPDWDKAVKIAEELDAQFIVTLDEIGNPEKSLKLSLETFKSTYIEKIVPFHAVTLGPKNAKQIKQHLRIFLDAGVRVFGIPCPVSHKNGQLNFALKCRWIIPTRCHALGFPFANKKLIRKLKYFESADATFFLMARSVIDRREMFKEILKLYQKIHAPEGLMDAFIEKEMTT